MTATNHALTGAAIGLIVGQPLLAIPLAVASHYICDVIPHFGTGLPEKVVLKSATFKNYLIAEAFICFLIVLGLALIQPMHWWLAAVCAFAAAAPDLLSINRFQTVRHNQAFKPRLYSRFASKIQWFERPIGGVVEVAWFVAAIIILKPFILS